MDVVLPTTHFLDKCLTPLSFNLVIKVKSINKFVYLLFKNETKVHWFYRIYWFLFYSHIVVTFKVMSSLFLTFQAGTGSYIKPK